MPAVWFRKFQFGLLLAAAFAISMWPVASRAYTPEQEQACSGDAMRICGSEIPDVDRITACMVRNKSQLSPPCQVFFRPDPEPTAAAGRPLSIRPPSSVGAKPRKARKPKADDDE
jgi:hypothetical protein